MTIKEQIIALLDDLNEYQQREVLLFVLSIVDNPRGKPGSEFLEHTDAGSLDQDMIDAIEEAFPILKASVITENHS